MNYEPFFEFFLAAAVCVVLPLAVSARLALRPIVEAIVRLREVMVSAGGERAQALEGEIEKLRTEISWLGREVGRLSEAESFYQQLMVSGRGDTSRDGEVGPAEGEEAQGLSEATEYRRITTG